MSDMPVISQKTIWVYPLRLSNKLFNEQSASTKFSGQHQQWAKQLLLEGVFEYSFVFAVIKRGNFMTSFTVTNVVVDFGTLKIKYETTNKPMKSGSLALPLILAIDKKNFDYFGMIVTENCKDVHNVDFKN